MRFAELARVARLGAASFAVSCTPRVGSAEPPGQQARGGSVARAKDRAPRTLALRLVAELEEGTEPQTISVAPDGRRWVVNGRTRAIVSTGGDDSRRLDAWRSGWQALALDRGVLYGETIHRRRDRPDPRPRLESRR
jgi:hypothetical protein